MGLLTDAVQHTRQHHAIEHATIHVLSSRHPGRSFSGYSDPLGFTILGDINEYDLRTAVGDALLRLQAGERNLAIHQNCGTNLLAVTVMATLAGIAATILFRRRFAERITASLVLTMLAVIASRPLGVRLQEYTTDAEVSDRWVSGIRLIEVGSARLLRVNFE